MLARLKRILPFVGYIAFYFFAFAMCCYFTFPYERLRDRIVAEFHASQKGQAKQNHLEIEEVSPYRLTGVIATGVRYITPGTAKGDTPAVPTTIEIEELRARLSILPLLIGNKNVSFYARAFGGELEGSFSDASKERKLELTMTDVAIGRIEPITGMIGLPLTGAIKGNVEMTFPDKRASKSSGSIKLSVADLSAGDGKAKIADTIALPKLQVGDLVMDAEVKEGVLHVNKLGAAGKDLDLISEGKITLRDQPLDSVADVYVRFKFSDNFRGKSDVTKSLFGAPGSSTPALFEFNPKVKQSKRTDGFYGWHMVGQLMNARFDPFAANPPGSASKALVAPKGF
jgi:type II secretion system protein N